MAHDNAFGTIIDNVCRAWPEHKIFLDRVWATSPYRETAEKLSASVLLIAQGDLTKFIDGYRWMCNMMMEEELHFRREGKYRLSSFSEVETLVYRDPEVMCHYMDGLLLSQVLWPNHVQAVELYLQKFIEAIPPGGKHLEVGPGHGLLLHYAMQMLQTAPEAWDISPAAIESTRSCLKALGDSAPANLICRDIMAIDDACCARYDSIVISEVLEHCENPRRMLCKVSALTVPGGIIYINVPVNSPSIDHIYLFKNPEEVAALVEQVGLEIEQFVCAPAAGYDEALARKRETTISCAVMARKVA